ncbi:hypothetical protein MMC21_000484 [Puttea exsequens]|nr:hypothetical protein [Puttea exsequens]
MLSRYQLLACVGEALFCALLLDAVDVPSRNTAQNFSGAFLIFFAAGAVYNVLVYPRISPLRHLPTPGQKSLRRLFKEPTPWLFEQWMKEIPNSGLIRYFGIFNQERLLLTTSEGVRDVLVTNPYHYHKQRAQKIHLEPVLGKGLVFVEDDTHKFHRKQMSPAFSSKCIRDCQPLFWKKTKEIIGIFLQQIEHQSIEIAHDKGWQASRDIEALGEQGETNMATESPGKVNDQVSGIVEVHDPVSRAALDIIGLAGCSFDFDSLNKEEDQNRMVRDYRKAFGVSTSNRIRCLMAHLFPAWIVDLMPIQRNRDIATVTQLVRRLATNIISTKRQCQSHQRQRCDFLDKTMQSGGFSDAILVEQVRTLLAAGHDTTSSTLASAAAMLSRPKYQHIQEKLRAEIRENLQSMSSSELASSTELENLPYLSAVTNEILRLFPPFSWYFRRSVVNTIICGHRVPKGTDIILCPWGMHRSKEHWGPNAEVFNPDRWLKDPSGRGGAKDACSFFTFAAGPRVCIAEKFARNEISTLVAGIFGQFRVEHVQGEVESPLSHQLTLTRIGGVRVRMTLLEGW